MKCTAAANRCRDGSNLVPKFCILPGGISSLGHRDVNSRSRYNVVLGLFSSLARQTPHRLPRCAGSQGHAPAWVQAAASRLQENNHSPCQTRAFTTRQWQAVFGSPCCRVIWLGKKKVRMNQQVPPQRARGAGAGSSCHPSGVNSWEITWG